MKIEACFQAKTIGRKCSTAALRQWSGNVQGAISVNVPCNVAMNVAR